jgi:hypothetical protein
VEEDAKGGKKSRYVAGGRERHIDAQRKERRRHTIRVEGKNKENIGRISCCTKWGDRSGVYPRE